MGRALLYVEVHGDDREHTEGLQDHVAGIVRGMGLATITEDTNGWPGSCDTFTMTEDGTTVRLSSAWDTVQIATDMGNRLVRFLNANLWSHHGALGQVWTYDLVNETAEPLSH